MSQSSILKPVIVLAALAAAAGSALANTDSAKLELRGSVGLNCTIAVTPTAKATSLSIVQGEKDTHVATVTENCNSGDGYVVKLNSDNAGRLLSKAAGAQPVRYSAQYDDAKGSIDSGMVAERNEAFFNRQGKLTVSFDSNPQAIAGTYTDVINLVIAAK